MRITTIIANYNYGWNIVKCINSALNQTIKNKVVVIDDGSNDKSVQIILANYKFNSKSESTIKNYKCELYLSDELDLIVTQNYGASTARNIGMWHSWNDTDIYCILDSDDHILEDKYKIFLSKILEYDEIGVVYGDYIINRDNYSKYEYKRPYSVSELSQHCMVHSGSMIRKTYLEKVLLSTGEIYDKNLHGPGSKNGCTEDYDLWLRLSKVCLMVNVPEALSIVNEHSYNASKKMTAEIFSKNMEIIRNRI